MTRQTILHYMTRYTHLLSPRTFHNIRVKVILPPILTLSGTSGLVSPTAFDSSLSFTVQTYRYYYMCDILHNLGKAVHHTTPH